VLKHIVARLSRLAIKAGGTAGLFVCASLFRAQQENKPRGTADVVGTSRISSC